MNMEAEAEETPYVNEDCPEGCSTEHAPPSPDDDGRWFCPDTEQVYSLCTDCGWETSGRYSTWATMVHGRWYCDPGEHEYCYCAGCDQWTSEHNTHYSERSEEYYCSNCYSDEEEYNSSRSARGEPIATCNACNTETTYFDEVSERFVCKCIAATLTARRSPVKQPAFA